VRFRQVEELLLRLADAAAEEAAAAERQPRLDDLKAAAPRVAPGIDEGRDAPQTVGASQMASATKGSAAAVTKPR